MNILKMRYNKDDKYLNYPIGHSKAFYWVLNQETELIWKRGVVIHRIKF